MPTVEKVTINLCNDAQFRFISICIQITMFKCLVQRFAIDESNAPMSKHLIQVSVNVLVHSEKNDIFNEKFIHRIMGNVIFDVILTVSKKL